ncbi:hypothetical protein NSP_18020 [Nodularia spumigena CCY9414]|nr:hypothetical protein NSP_18020 [Nodularia spumigena CCY9414]
MGCFSVILQFLSGSREWGMGEEAGEQGAGRRGEKTVTSQ